MRGRDRIAGESQRARQHARPAPGDEAEGNLAVGSVHRLVEAAVAGEDEDAVAFRTECVLDELRRVARPLSQEHLDLGVAPERRVNGGEARLGHAGRERVDDQDRLAHRPDPTRLLTGSSPRRCTVARSMRTALAIAAAVGVLAATGAAAPGFDRRHFVVSRAASIRPPSAPLRKSTGRYGKRRARNGVGSLSY